MKLILLEHRFHKRSCNLPVKMFLTFPNSQIQARAVILEFDLRAFNYIRVLLILGFGFLFEIFIKDTGIISKK